MGTAPCIVTYSNCPEVKCFPMLVGRPEKPMIQLPPNTQLSKSRRCKVVNVFVGLILLGTFLLSYYVMDLARRTMEQSRANRQAGTNPPSTDLAQCRSSNDCLESNKQYCQRGVCRPMGYCSSLSDCFNKDNQYPVGECAGRLFCNNDNNRCGILCGRSRCPWDKPLVNCLLSPCTVLHNFCSANIYSCHDHYCGGCHVFAFDEAGHSICGLDERVALGESKFPRCGTYGKSSRTEFLLLPITFVC